MSLKWGFINFDRYQENITVIIVIYKLRVNV